MKKLFAIFPLVLGLSVNAAELALSENVHVYSLNGEPVTLQGETLQLGNGPQVVMVRYDELFDISSEYHEFVRSGVQVLRFDAINGENYELSAPSLGLNAARDFAKAPDFSLQNQTGQNINFNMWSRDVLLAELLARPE